jgi:pantoate--beta-alanine ligase
MTRDLLFSHPLPENLHIVPTARSPLTGLALSSRNTYLSAIEHEYAPALYDALRAGEAAWDAGEPSEACLAAARMLIEERTKIASAVGVEMRLDYIAMNAADNFDVLEPSADGVSIRSPVIISGALWVGKTRLIDNVLINEAGRILIQN